MNTALIEKVANALLYEGYLLYPYRADSVKNRQRWSFGVLYPQAWSVRTEGEDPSSMRTQVLVRGDGAARLLVRVRFLDGTTARDVIVPPVAVASLVGAAKETTFRFEELVGSVVLGAERLDEQLHRVTVRIENSSPCDAKAGREAALRRSFASTHTLLGVEGAELVSLLEPPDELRAAAEGCANVGTWPVLVGEPGAKDAMLSSPIIVYDYPTIAPESPGDLFDGTEIDEILTLRILTLTDAEKAAVRAADPRARELLERTEGLSSDDLLRLHGRLRKPGALEERGLRVGARVRLRPRARADIFDMALAGMAATIVSLEHDYEGRVHVAVTVDDDPGKDLGAERQIGHRFFFGVDEVEPLDGAAA